MIVRLKYRLQNETFCVGNRMYKHRECSQCTGYQTIDTVFVETIWSPKWFPNYQVWMVSAVSVDNFHLGKLYGNQEYFVPSISGLNCLICLVQRKPKLCMLQMFGCRKQIFAFLWDALYFPPAYHTLAKNPMRTVVWPLRLSYNRARKEEMATMPRSRASES
jgi:hypothetical protein